MMLHTEKPSAPTSSLFTQLLRACADSSWPLGRMTFPAVERIQPSRMSRLTMMTTSVKATQKSTTFLASPCTTRASCERCARSLSSPRPGASLPLVGQPRPSGRSRRLERALVAAGGWPGSRSRDPGGCRYSLATLQTSVPPRRGSRPTAASRGGLPGR